MSEAVKVAIIVAIGPTLIGLLTLWRSKQEFDRLHDKTTQIYTATNGMHEALVKAVGELMYARGVKDEKERHEQK